MIAAIDFGTLTAAGASATLWRPRKRNITIYVDATGVTPSTGGATVYVAVHRLDGAGAGGFTTVATLAIHQNGNYAIQVTGTYSVIQVGLQPFTDGTFKITGEAS